MFLLMRAHGLSRSWYFAGNLLGLMPYFLLFQVAYTLMIMSFHDNRIVSAPYNWLIVVSLKMSLTFLVIAYGIILSLVFPAKYDSKRGFSLIHLFFLVFSLIPFVYMLELMQVNESNRSADYPPNKECSSINYLAGFTYFSPFTVILY